jgi:putative transposase
MTKRPIYDQEGHAHYVTFSCYKRRRLLMDDKAKGIVIGVLNSELAKIGAKCAGFVVMPDHVHAILWFPKPNQLSRFMKQWKQRTSVEIKKLMKNDLPNYLTQFDVRDPVWQPRYYSFNIFSAKKLKEKIDYIHENSVRAGLVDHPGDWIYSSAGYYLSGKSVGLPIEAPG